MKKLLKDIKRYNTSVFQETSMQINYWNKILNDDK